MFERSFYYNTKPVGFYWIITYMWSISLCQIAQLQESEMRPTSWTLSWEHFQVSHCTTFLHFYHLGQTFFLSKPLSSSHLYILMAIIFAWDIWCEMKQKIALRIKDCVVLFFDHPMIFTHHEINQQNTM